MVGQDFRDRIGWEQYLRPFLYKELPPGHGLVGDPGEPVRCSCSGSWR